MNIELALLIMAVCLLLEAFFSGSELGIVSADPMTLRHKAAKGSRGRRRGQNEHVGPSPGADPYNLVYG